MLPHRILDFRRAHSIPIPPTLKNHKNTNFLSGDPKIQPRTRNEDKKGRTFFPGPQKNRLISITTCTCESQQDSRTPKITSGIRTCKGQSHLSRNAQKGKVTTASWKRKANIQRWESNPPPPTPQREHASTEPHRQIQTVEK